MSYEIELTKSNRLKIATAFRGVPQVDVSIPCVVEGQMGQAFVDDLAQPTIYHGVIGPFHYFAGPSDTPQAQAMMADFPAYNLLLACLERGLHPNWDAANPESAQLAEKMGYCSTGSYEAYFYAQNG